MTASSDLAENMSIAIWTRCTATAAAVDCSPTLDVIARALLPLILYMGGAMSVIGFVCFGAIYAVSICPFFECFYF